MKKFAVFLFIFFLPFAWADDFVPIDENTEVNSNDFILDSDNSGGNIKVQFGTALAEYLQWNNTNNRFDLSDSLRVGGNIESGGTIFTLDADNSGAGSNIEIRANQGTDNDGSLRYNSGENLWEFSNNGNSFTPIGSSYSLVPYLTNTINFVTGTSETQTFTLLGNNFGTDSIITIPGFDGSVNSVNVINPSKMEVNITAGTTIGLFDIIVTSSGMNNTVWTGNGEDLLEVRTISPWKDLRIGGDSFTSGNSSGNDIRHKNNMTLNRDANGMYFTGQNPWSSWVKFESLGWTRLENKTLQWIFTAPSSSMMIGIGSDATNENSSAQYAQAEVQIYFSSSTNMWGLYGNNGNIGSYGNQSQGNSISSSGIYKAKFEADGGVGSTLTLYQLPSADPSDWDNENTIITSFQIGGTLNPDEDNIFPFIIPRNGGSQRFIAVKVQ